MTGFDLVELPQQNVFNLFDPLVFGVGGGRLQDIDFRPLILPQFEFPLVALHVFRQTHRRHVERVFPLIRDLVGGGAAFRRSRTLFSRRGGV